VVRKKGPDGSAYGLLKRRGGSQDGVLVPGKGMCRSRFRRKQNLGSHSRAQGKNYRINEEGSKNQHNLGGNAGRRNFSASEEEVFQGGSPATTDNVMQRDGHKLGEQGVTGEGGS